MTIEGSLYWSISILKRFSAAKKKTKFQSKSVPKMAVFRKFKGLHINCGHRDPQKAHPWPERGLLEYSFCKNPFRGIGCSELQEPKKALKTSPQMVWKIMYMGSKNSWRERDKIWYAEWHPRRCHARQFLWRSVKGFWCGKWLNFGLFHWLAMSPLKHSRYVRVCDEPCLWIDCSWGHTS